MQIGKGFLAGVIAAGVTSLAMALLRLVGVPVGLELVLGTLVTHDLAAAQLAGFGLHIVVGGGLGVLYAALFEYVVGGARWASGAAIGLLHAAVGGTLLGLSPRLHPLIPERLPAPGPFFAGLGASGVIGWLGLHLLFGAIVGEIYRPVKLEHRRPAAA